MGGAGTLQPPACAISSGNLPWAGKPIEHWEKSHTKIFTIALETVAVKNILFCAAFTTTLQIHVNFSALRLQNKQHSTATSSPIQYRWYQ